MRPIGFSTGAVAKQDFAGALNRLRRFGVRIVELSALRYIELEPLAQALPHLDLSDFDFVSFHAPSRIEPANEQFVIDVLSRVTGAGIPIVVHPDVILTPASWLPFGSKLLIENM